MKEVEKWYEKKQDEISSILWHEYFIKAHTGEYDAAKKALKKQKEIDLAKAKKSKNTYVISIQTDGYQWLEGSAYWESPTLSIPTTEENKKALKEHLEGKKKQRKGV